MKNLKRVLSLGLASVMLLGMMVVGASAKDFTDAADITHAEAVETMVALNVIKGKEDGSYFDPKGNVTRGEMAKMIAVAMQGGKDDTTGVKGNPSFTDIKGHWAESYIEYCYDLSIISGRGDGTFDPNGNVTGLEAAKMVLTALGYDAEAYKLNGASWATRTAEVARTSAGKSLYESLDNITMSAPATRDTAAQLIWNGLQAYTVTVTPGQNKNNGEVTWNYNTDNEITLLKQRYNANVMLATFIGNKDFGASGALKGEIGVTSKRAVKLDDVTTIAANSTFVFPAEMDIDNIDEEVKVIWKNGEKSSSNGPDKNDVIYGVFNTGATRVLRTQLSKVNNRKDTGAKIKIDNVDYDVTATGTTVNGVAEADVEVVVNYAKRASFDSDNGTSSGNSDLTKALKVNSGWPIKAVFDDNGKIYKIYMTRTYIGAVTSVSSTSVSINNGIGILKFADHDIEDGLKKGDVVAVTPLYYTSNAAGGVCTVKKAEKVSGTVTGWKDDEAVTMDGKVYKTNYVNDTKADVADLGWATSPNPSGVVSVGLLDQIPDEPNVVATFNGTGNTYIDKEFDLYLINGYLMGAVKTDKSANNYSVITEVKTSSFSGTTFNALQLQVMGADGTKEIITVSKDSSKAGTHAPGSNIGTASYSVGDIITYTFNKDDEADVTVEQKVSIGSLNYSEKAQTVGTAVTAADCVLFVQTKGNATDATNMGNVDSTPVASLADGDWEVYDIRALDSLNIPSVARAVATDNNGKVVAVFVNLGNTPNGAEDNTVYAVISDYKGKVKDYYSYTAQCNGEEYTILEKHWDRNGDLSVNNSDLLVKGDLVAFRPTADDTYAAGKIDLIGAGKTVVPNQGFVKEYNSSDNTLTLWLDRTAKGATRTNLFDYSTTKTYALDKDCKIVYVDQDGDKSAAESSITEASEMTGYVNVVYLTKDVDTVEVIKAIFVEVSGEAHIDNYNKPAANTSVALPR